MTAIEKLSLLCEIDKITSKISASDVFSSYNNKKVSYIEEKSNKQETSFYEEKSNEKYKGLPSTNAPNSSCTLLK